MTFDEFNDAISALAGDECSSVRMERITYTTGLVETQFCAYSAEVGWIKDCKTAQEAVDTFSELVSPGKRLDRINAQIAALKLQADKLAESEPS